MYVKSTYAFFKQLKNNKTYVDISLDADIISCNAGRKNVDFRKSSQSIFQENFSRNRGGVTVSVFGWIRVKRSN